MMGGLFRKTAKMLASRGSVLREELTVEGQKLLDTYNDPNVSPEEKEKCKKQLDSMIEDLEKRIETTRRLKEKKPKEQAEGE
jgi:hypothetical protein